MMTAMVAGWLLF